MPAALLLHPFRIEVSGRVAVAEQGSDDYLSSQIGVVVGTRIGERDMCQPFGVPDAAFAHLAAGDVQTCLDRFGPDGVQVTDVTTVQTGEFTEAATVTWERV